MNSTFLHPIIYFLVRHGIPVSLCLHRNGQIVYNVDGFYKSGNVSLVPHGENFKAVARYGDETEINDVRDLAALNLHWWNSSNDRFDGWAEPDPHWLPLLIEFGMVKEKIVKTYENQNR